MSEEKVEYKKSEGGILTRAVFASWFPRPSPAAVQIPFGVPRGHGVNHHDCLNASVAVAFPPHPLILLFPLRS